MVKLIYGRDNVVRGAKIQTEKGVLERTPQHLFPLELKCDLSEKTQERRLNAEASVFRPKRQQVEKRERRFKQKLLKNNI